MSQLIQIVFNEAVPVGDEVYPEGYLLTLPADQAFGSHARRQLAPFDLFDTALELVTDLGGDFYRLAYNMEITIGPRTIRQSDLFSYVLPTSPAFGWLTAIVNDNGSFTVQQSNMAILLKDQFVKPGVTNTLNLTFFFRGVRVDVTGEDLMPVGDGTFNHDVSAPMRPGAWQYTLSFSYNGVNYDYPLSLSVLQPGLTIRNMTPSMKAGAKGIFQFYVERKTGINTLTYPEVKIASAMIDGGTPGDLYEQIPDGTWGLEITPKDVVFTMNLRLVLNIEGWLVPWMTTVVVTQKAASMTVVDGGMLRLNLTQVVKLRIISEGKLVSSLTTKNLKLSGSPSYHTYSKSLVKLEDGLYQFSIYTNNVEGTMYADIVVTIDGVDLAIPKFPITVRNV